MKKGKVILIFGVSTVGKTYYKNLLSEKYKLQQLQRVVTRVKRDSEVKTSDIHVSKEEFKRKKNKKKFFIDAKIHGEYYGFLKSDFEKMSDGTILIGDCYYKLLKELKEALGNNLTTICIQPENFEYTKKLIKKERTKYKTRIKDSMLEYDFFEKILNCMDKIIRGK